MDDDFARFEHEGWQRVADKYDSVWSTLTRQFIPALLADASVSAGLVVLDVACGPGYLSAAAKKNNKAEVRTMLLIGRSVFQAQANC